LACSRPFLKIVFFLSLLGLFGQLNLAVAQSILAEFRWLRTQEIARESFNKTGYRVLSRPVVPFLTKTDSLREWVRSMDSDLTYAENSAAPRFKLDSWHKVDLEQEIRFMSLFEDTEWAFIGSTTRQRVDTTRTRDLRARMQAVFGSPTRTLVELGPIDSLSQDQVIEFEYWFVLNDSIPVIVLDTNGPWDRGLVVASSALNRLQLDEIKAVFLGQLVQTDLRSSFADYYYNPSQEQWYVTGYDGASFFDVRIGTPDLKRGRPVLASSDSIPDRFSN
jgi:hypothetical protein